MDNIGVCCFLCWGRGVRCFCFFLFLGFGWFAKGVGVRWIFWEVIGSVRCLNL